MKFRLVKVPRRPAWPAWAIVVTAAWFALVAAATWQSARTGHEVTLCAFKNLTGKPCVTCGATRGVLAILHGHVLEAWTYNPLVFTVLAAMALSLALRVGLARAVRVELTRLERPLAWILLLLAVAANWAYVIAYVG